MPRDPHDYHVISTPPLSESPSGIDMCLWCKNPVYDRARYVRNAELREEVKRGHASLSDTMHIVTGPGGERSVCGACVKRLGIHALADAERDDTVE